MDEDYLVKERRDGEMGYNWISVMGDFDQAGEKIIFKGGLEKDTLIGNEFPTIGNYICDKTFGGGEIEATVIFPELATDANACGLIFCYDSDRRYFITASVEKRKEVKTSFALKYFDSSKWIFYDAAGYASDIKKDKEYKLKVIVEGSNERTRQFPAQSG